jgi:hypothetical protein
MRMGAGCAVLDPPHMQDGAIEVDLVPAQVAGLGGAQPVPEGHEDHGRVPVPVPIGLGGFDQGLGVPGTERNRCRTTFLRFRGPDAPILFEKYSLISEISGGLMRSARVLVVLLFLATSSSAMAVTKAIKFGTLVDGTASRCCRYTIPHPRSTDWRMT